MRVASISSPARVPTRASKVLATAYRDTKLGQWLVPGGWKDRQQTLARWADVVLADAADRGTVDVTQDQRAVAVWLPGPAGFPEDFWTRLAEATGAHYDRFASCYQALRRHAPRTSHRQLLHIGVAPDHRRGGRATFLIREQLRTCDNDGVTAYAVTTNPSLTGWLARFRFQVSGPPIQLGPERSLLHPMARTPEAVLRRSGGRNR